jgi:type II secretory pathway component GspD/PulD (secretin)
LATGAAGQSKTDDAKPSEPRPADTRVPPVESYQVFYLTHAMQIGDLQDIQTDLRNMLPRAKVYGVPSQYAISVRGTADDLLLAQKVVTELDRAPKSYQLTYTINETDGGKHTGAQHFSMVVVSGVKTNLKEGNRVPIVTGTSVSPGSAPDSQMQYIDVGLSIEATFDGVRLHTKVEQSHVSDEKSSIGLQDPVILQTLLEGTATLAEGKPVVLGALDIPGGTRHEEVEVVAQALR